VLQPFPSKFYEEGEEGSTVDKSQWDAVRLMLTNPLAIVQGPPGTGKTFVSIVALRLLLSKMKDRDPPIIVATQTNHALDQLLRYIGTEIPDSFARLGGRSKDDGIVKMRTLFELRRQLDSSNRIHDPKGTRRQASHTLRAHGQMISNALSFFKNDEPDINHFVEAGILDKEQADSIVRGDDWVGAERDTGNPLLQWLGRQVKESWSGIPLQELDEMIEEAEAVLEPEAIDERKAEANTDDFLDVLRGQFIPICQKWVGKGEAMGQAQADNLLQNRDMQLIPAGQRGRLFNYLMDQYKNYVRAKIREIARHYAKAAKHFKLGGFERDMGGILNKQKLIGMTTTGLSKYRAMVNVLKPKILLIEEAAEILEAPVVAGLLPSIEHIMLVGDHQQLKPQCQIKDHQGDPFYFDLSMFERLVKNKFDYRMLTKQRRMIPEVRRLLKPIYGDVIEDHECVKGRDDVPGMGSINTFLWKHDFVEGKDASSSTMNEEEARMIVGFCFYLLHNGVKRQNITIVTFYNAQRRLINKKLAEEARNHTEFFDYNADDKSTWFKVVTVDSYQGEENEVIILSLVRSNSRDVIGFAGIENRVCVALSRARNGLYIFGNMDMFARVSGTWEIVQRIMSDPLIPRTGREFPITCEKHGNTCMIMSPDMWADLDGGCNVPCAELLPCGHVCPLLCHS
jgi:helicase required for RNAi-mediated heterochromatin assembly 1